MNSRSRRRVLGGAVIIGLGILTVRWLSLDDGQLIEPRPASQPEIRRDVAEDASGGSRSRDRSGADEPAAMGAVDPSRPDRSARGSKRFSFSNFEEGETPSRELVRAAIEATVAEHFTSYRLSSDELERATDALLRLRETQEALRALPMGRETAEERRLLVERIGEATSSFNEVLDMDPADFTADAVPGVGIDRFDPNEIPPEAEFIELDR